MTHTLTEECMPLSVQTAETSGMIDEILISERSVFMGAVLKHGMEPNSGRVFSQQHPVDQVARAYRAVARKDGSYAEQ